MNPLTRAVVKNFIQIGFYLAIFAASLFFPAGQLGWTMGWVYLAINVLSMLAISMILLFRNSGLLQERVNRKGKRDWDRVLAGCMTLFGPISICVVSGFNFRYQWPPQVPVILQVTGILLAILGCILSSWAIASNKFFYGFLRIAREAGHSVSSDGAYRLVRHPGYLGAVVLDLASPLILNSVWAFIPAVLTILAIFMRTKLEDEVLQRDLEGYQSYTRQVRYRLLPLIW